MCAMMGSDKRRSERIDVALVAAVTGLSQSKPKTTQYLLTKDICDQGVFFQTKERPEMDSSISAKLALPTHGLRLTLDGELHYGKMDGHVVRLDGGGFAAVFDDEYHIDFWGIEYA